MIYRETVDHVNTSVSDVLAGTDNGVGVVGVCLGATLGAVAGSLAGGLAMAGNVAIPFAAATSPIGAAVAPHVPAGLFGAGAVEGANLGAKAAKWLRLG
jgi:hypothetical protein